MPIFSSFKLNFNIRYRVKIQILTIRKRHLAYFCRYQSTVTVLQQYLKFKFSKSSNLMITMNRLKLTSIGVTALLAALISCQPDNKNLVYESDSLKLPEQPFNYILPTKGEAAGISFQDNNANPITNNGATLGRVLFYDKKLSLNNQISCASCHRQEIGFADNQAFSTGFQGAKTTRNALAITNASLEKTLFWDTRANSLEDLALRPIQNHIEMGIEDMEKLSAKLAKISYYPDLFQKTFGSKDINGDRIAKAMSQFMRSMVTYRSKFDEGKNANFTNFTFSEKRGKELFMNQLHCNNCHGGDNFNTTLDGQLAENIGLDAVYKDNGVGQLTGNTQKNGVFKVPSLRNVSLTAPYMHDGRFATLIDVVNHYDHNLQNHENLMPSLRTFTWAGNGGSFNSGGSTGWGGTSPIFNFSAPRSLNLSDSDKAALIDFLKTLADPAITKDERFSNPFKI